MRSSARETVLQYLFSQFFNPTDEELFVVIQKNEKLNESDKLFSEQLLAFVTEGKDKYLKTIEELSEGFSLNRIFTIDKCALLIGMAELENCPETPTPVVIDEAVKLVAKYSAEKSTDFVNGILAEYSRTIRKQ